MSRQCLSVLNDDSVLLCGYYKKLKTMKKKFFVLYNETSCKVARIEYFDSEKKYKTGLTPKRIIKIKNCFNINRRLHTKHDYVIVLASKEGGFGIVMESEEEMNTWLNHLLHLQRSGATCFDFPKFDYVWQVSIQKKGIAEHHGIFGSHHICLTNKSVTFVKIGREKNLGDKKLIPIEVLLTTIRRCGDSQCYFYMEIGRQSSYGPGELWMETEDSLTAQDMHRMILSKMISLNEALAEPMRRRSSSATETTNVHHDKKSLQTVDATNNFYLNAQNFSRDRCDSLPSRNRTSSECSSHNMRTITTSSINRVLNFHIGNPSLVTCSASDEFICVDDAEQNLGMPCIMRQHFSIPTSSFGSIYENDTTKEAIGNRVRAFSVGSRIKNSRLCSKTSPKLFTSDSVHSSTRKSVSVPVLVNKNLQSIDQMSDLMEIDFSKSIDESVDRNICHIANKCQDVSKVFQTNLNISTGSIHKNKKKVDNGYLEMKPITSDANHLILLRSNPINKASVHLQNLRNSEEKDNKIDSTISIEAIDNIMPISNLTLSNYPHLNDKNAHATDNDLSLKGQTSTSLKTTSTESSTCSKHFSDDYKLHQQLSSTCVNNDLYYASLDLPKCGNDINSRYGFQENFSDANIEEIKNEYAKINFDQPDTSRSLTTKKH